MAIGICLSFLYALMAGFVVTELAHAQDQSGFISIDCGIPDGSTNIDSKTSIKYVSDATYVDTGINKNISSEFVSTSLDQLFWNVRSFPQGIRNCYTLKLKHGNNITYLIRASFMYGNYDGQNIVPEFGLYLGVNFWDSIKLDTNTAMVTKEINHIPSSDTISICLVNTGHGTPFISALELRYLRYSVYEFKSKSVALRQRWNLGSTTDQVIRFKEDVYDRIWVPINLSTCRVINTSLPVVDDYFTPPPVVLSTAVTPIIASQPISFLFKAENDGEVYTINAHFSEVEELEANQLREFNLTLNGESWSDNIVPRYLKTDTSYTITRAYMKGESIKIVLTRTNRSTLPPIINSFEIFASKETPEEETDQDDVNAIKTIKYTYGVKRDWQGDPCSPRAYLWGGLNCSYSSLSPRIISLNLSSSGLSGEITPHLANLSLIQTLDLSNNSLTGSIPEFLARLTSLKILNLSGNKLSGSVPEALIRRSNEGTLSLSMDNHINVCSSNECQPKKKKEYTVPIVVAAVILVLLVSGVIAIWYFRRSPQVSKTGADLINNDETVELDQQRYTYPQIVKMTNNFETILGKGGFGTVYLGHVDESKVAVKVLGSSVHGTKEFQTEVKLLMRVHHKNLTGLVGYFSEGPKMGLIYEFMSNGDLQVCLSGSNGYILSWEDRLRIAKDAAQGLEYLHIDCNPPIIHRDVKSTNILLNDKLEAKLADFGMSRIFPIVDVGSGRQHVTTVVAGTPGYLDPEYYVTSWLNEKSDVYSFGIVLLEMITSKPVIAKTTENAHIGQWMKFMLANSDDIDKIIDPRLRGNYDIDSAEIAVEVAMACIALTSESRPSMNYVISELNECLARELARTNGQKSGADIDNSSD